VPLLYRSHASVMQKKEMLLAKLRRELLISDQRHERMREMIKQGAEVRERYPPPSFSPKTEGLLHLHASLMYCLGVDLGQILSVCKWQSACDLALPA